MTLIQKTMKHKLTFENASVVGVCNGEITLKLENGITKYFNASLLTVNDGRVEILVSRPLTMGDLETGMVVKYDDGQHRLVIKINDGLIKLAELKGGGYGTIRDDAFALLSHIVTVWEPRTAGSLDEWLKITPDRKVIFER